MGSDGQEIEFGMNFLYKHNLKISTEVGISQIGEETITERVFDPYKDYLKIISLAEKMIFSFCNNFYSSLVCGEIFNF